MKIWRCPTCSSGVRAPARMRRDNALRYCLRCTAKTGKLVERVCPSAESERARREAEKKALEAKRAERSAAKETAHAGTERGRLEAFARQWLKLEAFREGLVRPYRGYRIGVPTFQIRLSASRKSTRLVRTEETNPDGSFRGATYTEIERTRPRPSWSTGHAYYGRHHFCVTAGTEFTDALATILHEIAHLASRHDHGHGPAWRACFQDAVREATGEPGLVLSGANKYDYHRAACDAVKAWYERTNKTCEEPGPALLLEAT